MATLPDSIRMQLRHADNALIDAQEACIAESDDFGNLDVLDALDDVQRARRILVALIGD